MPAHAFQLLLCSKALQHLDCCNAFTESFSAITLGLCVVKSLDRSHTHTHSIKRSKPWPSEFCVSLTHLVHKKLQARQIA